MTSDGAGRDEFIDWGRRTAIPLVSTAAGSGDADLEPLLDRLAAARLVGLGEATHGTREFFTLKHRLVELLVQRAGFDQFLIEASLPDAMAVDEWITDGVGDPAVALAGMHFWVWDTEEVLAAIRWMRGRKVRFRGVDVQYGPTAAWRLAALATRTNGAEPMAELEPLLDPLIAGSWARVEPSCRRAALGKAQDLLGDVPEAGLPAARRLERYLTGWSEFELQPDIWEMRRHRDEEMARWSLDWLGSSRGIVWAHNQHVGRDGFSGRFPSMGSHLAASLGDGYVPVGFSFARGSFRATDSETGRLAAITVDRPPTDSLETALEEIGLPLFALTWQDLPAAARDWLATLPRTRSIGSGFSSNDTAVITVDPSTQYDVLIHVSEASAARPNPTAERPPEPIGEVFPAAANLDFRDVLGNGLPANWTVTGDWSAGGYHVMVSAPGELFLQRRDPAWRHGRVQVYQRVEAGRWRGRRLRMSGRVSAHGGLEAGSARLLISSHGAGGSALGYSPRPATDGSWTAVAAELDVPEDAESVAVAVAVSGAPGRIRVSGLELDPSRTPPP